MPKLKGNPPQAVDMFPNTLQSNKRIYIDSKESLKFQVVEKLYSMTEEGIREYKKVTSAKERNAELKKIKKARADELAVKKLPPDEEKKINDEFNKSLIIEKVIIQTEQNEGTYSLLGAELTPDFISDTKKTDLMYIHFSPDRGQNSIAHCYIYDLKHKISKKHVIEHCFEQLEWDYRFAKFIVSAVEYEENKQKISFTPKFHFGVCTELFDENAIREEIAGLTSSGSTDDFARSADEGLLSMLSLANIENQKRCEYLEMMLKKEYTIGGESIGIDVRNFKKFSKRKRILEMHFKNGILQEENSLKTKLNKSTYKGEKYHGKIFRH